MKTIKNFYFYLCVFIGIFISCSPIIKYSTPIPEIKPLNDKALVVIIRAEPKSQVEYNTEKMSIFYIDGIFKGVNNNNTVTFIEVDTGSHYLMARIDNTALVKLNFRAQKVYFICQNVSASRVTAPTPGKGGSPSGGLTRVLTTIEPISKEKFLNIEKSGNFKFSQYNAAKPLKDMEPQAKKAHITAYEFWAQAKPDQAQKHLDYQGY
jgi:hypothetical protein